MCITRTYVRIDLLVGVSVNVLISDNIAKGRGDTCGLETMGFYFMTLIHANILYIQL